MRGHPISSGLYPESGFQLAILEEGAAVATNPAARPSRRAATALPDPGTIVLVLGDLGCLARQQEQRGRLMRMWLEWGRRLQANANPALAIVPCHPNRCGGELARLWTILPWETASLTASAFLSDDETAELTDQVLTRLAFALRVEPQLGAGHPSDILPKAGPTPGSSPTSGSTRRS